MGYRQILVTGGAGFIGAHLALALKAAYPGAAVTAFDNLSREGSALSLERLAAGGVRFHKGDLRNPQDLEVLPDPDLVIDAAAEPSVQAGLGGGLAELFANNLTGTQNLLTRVRASAEAFLFLSTSRVYSIEGLQALEPEAAGSRLEPTAFSLGSSPEGITADFSTAAPRSFYGTSKLASELLVEEICAEAGIAWIIDRCSCVAGPWQMGRTDQGFLALWLARHAFGGRLDYHGYGGLGLQVRDLLHVADLTELILRQLESPSLYGGTRFNVGGGRGNAISLAELTQRCRALGAEIEVGSQAGTHPFDVPWYVTDNAAVSAASGWMPRRGLDELVEDTWRWIQDEREGLAPIMG